MRQNSRRAALLVAVAAGLLGPSAVPAAAAPPTPAFGRVADSYADYVAQDSCDPVAKPGVLDFRRLVLSTYRQTTDLGIVRGCDIGGTSEHKEGRAWDWGVSATTQPAVAADLLGWLMATDRYGNKQAMLRRLGIMYVIWNKRIFGAYAAEQGWRPYECGGSTGRDCHTTHVHFSFSWDGALQQTSWWTGVPVVRSRWTAWRPLDRPVLGGPDLASRSPGSIDMVVRGSDAALYQRQRRSGSRWGAWQPLGGRLTSDPAAVSWGTGRLDVFARGTDNALWHRAYSGGRWSPWQSLGGVLAGAPDVTSEAAGQLDVVVVGTTRMLYKRTYQAGAWGPWQPLGGILTADPAVTSWQAGRLDVFGRGTDNALWHRFRTRGVWYPWHRLGGTLLSGVDATSWGPGRLDVVFTGPDSHVYRRSYTAEGGWTTEQLTGVVTSAPAVVSPFEGAVSVAARLDTGAPGWRQVRLRVRSGSSLSASSPGG